MQNSKLYPVLIYIIIVVLSFLTIPKNFADDNTKVGLPEGAIARLGKGGINIIRFSPDGTYLAVGTDVGVWLYDVQDGTETALFSDHVGHVNALAFSQDGNLLASGGFNNPVIEVWDLDNKSNYATIELNQPTVTLSALAFYGRILVGYSSREVIYWKVEDSRALSKIDFAADFYTVAFSKDGSNLAAIDKQEKIRLFDTRSSSQYAMLPGHRGGRDSDIHALAFSPDNSMLLSGGEDRTVLIWDVQDQVRMTTLRGHNAWVTAVAWSEDGKTVASGDAGKNIILWDMETQKEQTTIKGHENTINALDFSPVETPVYGKCLASGSADGTIRLWNPIDGSELTTLASGYIEAVKVVAFSEDSTNLASAAINGTVDVWSLKTHQELTTFSKTRGDLTEAVILSDNAQFLASASGKGMIHFKPVGTGFSYSGVGSQNIQFWNILTGERLLPHSENVSSSLPAPAFTSDGNILAFSRDREIVGWHLKSNSQLFAINTGLPRHEARLVFSPDKRKLAVMGKHSKPKIWDITTQRNITPANIKRTYAIAFSSSSSLLAAVSEEGIYLWNLDNESDKKHFIIPAKPDIFDSTLTFSPDDKVLVESVCSGWDPQIRLWHVATGLNLGNISGHTESVKSLVFSHDGKTLASGSNDGTVLLWDWDKIKNNIIANHKEEDLISVLIPVPEPITYASKTEEAKAVLKWLNDNGYQIEQLTPGYRLTRENSSSTISNPDSGIIGVGDVRITIDKGVLKIRIEDIGSADFIFDEDDKLIHKVSIEQKTD